MAKLDFPSSPVDGQVYAAPNGVDYTWSSAINAWTAKVTDPVALVSNGSISGTAEVGKTLVYTIGEASGGVPPYTYSWEWRRTSDDSVLQVGGITLLTPASAAGDTIYIFLTATDSVANTVDGSTGVFPVGGSVITYAPFPNLSFSPNPSPNASPPTISVPTQNLYGTVSATWNDNYTNISSTGALRFSVNGGAYTSTSTPISGGDTLSLVWDTAAISAAADGDTLVGILTDGTYENGFSITVDRAPTGLVFADLVDQDLSTVITSDTVTPTGFNVPVPVSFTGSATALTSLGLSVGGGSFASSPQTVNPGQSLQLRGTTGGANSTAYGVNIAMGSNPTATDTWTVTTLDPVPTIVEPSITAPTNGATDINPALNPPASIQFVSSEYSTLNGAGAQTSSTWEVTSGSPGGTPIAGSPFTVSSAPFNTLTIPQSSFSVSTTYYVRVQYATTNASAATSEWSPWSEFQTASSFLIPPGTAMAGGYYGGQIDDGGTIYNLIVAPVNGGQYGGLNSAVGLQWKTSATVDSQGTSLTYGQPMTVYGASQGGTYPAFNWIVNDPSGPNAGVYDATNTTGTGIGGYNDWYMPAYYENAILMFTLKPTTGANTTTVTRPGGLTPSQLNGYNPYSVEPYTPNTPFTASWPAQTTSAIFQAGGSEAFTTSSTNNKYWSASDAPYNSGNATLSEFLRAQSDLQGGNKLNFTPAPNVRAIRRIVA